MLVEESTSNLIPINLQELVQSLKKSASCKLCDLSRHDLLVCVLCTLMKECDLQPIKVPQVCYGKHVTEETNVIPLCNLPNIWKNTDTRQYNISFVLGHFIKNRFRFIGIPSKDLLIVNVIICGLPKQCYSMSIPCNDYVDIDDKNCENIASVFHNLRDLSLKFKNSIAHPVRSAVLNEEGIVNASFLGIPHEIQLKILGYSSIADLGQLSQTCHYFSYLSKDQRLWKNIARRVMTRDEIDTTEIDKAGETNFDWKQECKEALRRRCEVFWTQRNRRNQCMHNIEPFLEGMCRKGMHIQLTFS